MVITLYYLYFQQLIFSILIRVQNVRPEDRGSIDRGLGDFSIFTAPRTNLMPTVLPSGYREVFSSDKGGRKMRLNTQLCRGFEVLRH
jgi:hypothetical protein